jgi:FKBP-type peptidyl-prolyl cis-trans isomerase
MRTTSAFTLARRLFWALLLPLLLLGASACKDDNNSQEELNRLIEENKVKDDEAIRAYLTTNNITNATKTSSGLYVIRTFIAPTGGDMPLDKAQVRTKYVGRYLSTGLRFDASIDNGSMCGCAVFTIGSVIPAWNEVLVTMHKDDKVTILVPSHLGYGAAGNGATIPAFTPLMFDIELIDFTNP